MITNAPAPITPATQKDARPTARLGGLYVGTRSMLYLQMMCKGGKQSMPHAVKLAL